MLPFRDINPSRNFPLVTITIIVINVLIFFYMLTVAQQGGEEALRALVERAGVIPREYTRGAEVGASTMQPVWLTLFTAMFMHGGPVHLLGNMLYLWIFGNNIEDIMGGVRFLLFYLVCGIIASFAQIFVNPESAVPMIGASGAIAGVLGAYLVRFPGARVDTCLLLPFFFYVVRLPAVIVLAFWFLIQLASGTLGLLEPREGGGVAWFAHIGGFLAGMIFVLLFAKRRQSDYRPNQRW